MLLLRVKESKEVISLEKGLTDHKGISFAALDATDKSIAYNTVILSVLWLRYSILFQL